MIRLVSVIVVAIGLSFAAGCFSQPDELHRKEAILREDLFSIRQAIDQYSQERNHAPRVLDDLISAGYLRAIPKDPFTNSAETWRTVQEDTKPSSKLNQPGIVDIHSGSDQVASDGKRYSDW